MNFRIAAVVIALLDAEHVEFGHRLGLHKGLEKGLGLIKGLMRIIEMQKEKEGQL